MREETFLKRFEKNCKERITSQEQAKSTITSLNFGNCPFPEVCRDAYIACTEVSGRTHKACPGNPRKGFMNGHDCPISYTWQRQVAYFHPKRDSLELINKMITIVKNLWEIE